ncbi:TnsA endonuclease N-terminal domain-containing protein [Variovorax sp. R-27]|uniref:TnsA endonuclease N-terminal domain-containing protein n=1 Tax=Variovorax sp. R-27 TaxID=3404058 RepID=UPI003CED7192
MDFDSPAPARRVVSRSPIRTVRRLNLPGIFEEPVECESSLERDFVLRAALSPSVVRLRHQPFQLKQPSGRRYTPDFLVTHADGTRVVVEIKPRERVERYRGVFDFARAELKAHQVDFLVLDETSIRRAKTHERAALVLRYRKSGIDPAARLRLLACVGECPRGLAIGSLAKRSAASRVDVLHLIATRAVRVSRSVAIDDSSLVFPLNPLEASHEFRTDRWFDAALW